MMARGMEKGKVREIEIIKVVEKEGVEYVLIESKEANHG